MNNDMEGAPPAKNLSKPAKQPKPIYAAIAKSHF